MFSFWAMICSTVLGVAVGATPTLHTSLYTRILCTKLHVRVGHALLEAAEGERRCGRYERPGGGAAGERAVDLRRER